MLESFSLKSTPVLAKFMLNLYLSAYFSEEVEIVVDTLLIGKHILSYSLTVCMPGCKPNHG